MLRRFLFWGILLSTVWLATTHGSAVSQIVATARYGLWQWFALAVVLQVAFHAVRVALYRMSFRIVGVPRTLRELLPLTIASVYLTTVVPGAGASGRSLLAQDAIRRGAPAEKASQMPVVARLADFSGFAVVMFAGFAYLFTFDTLRFYEVVASTVVLGTILALGAGLALAVLRPTLLSGFLGRVEKGLVWFAGLLRKGPSSDWSERVTERYALAGRTIARDPRGLLAAWALAILAYSLDLASFCAVGFALGWPALGALVASFAVGMLVWLVSIVPQGIGVVEAVIALMLASFGADAPTALAISLGFRAITFWIPLAIGAALVRFTGSFDWLRQEAADVFPVRLAAVVTFLVGVMNLLSALTPAVVQRLALLESILPLQSEYGRLSAALAGIALIALARGLWRRKQLVWLATVSVLSVSIVSHIVKGLDYEEALISLALLIFLLIKRSAFQAKSDAPSIRQGLRVLAAAFGVTLAYGTLGFFLLDRQFGLRFTVWPAVRQTVVMFTQFYNPGVVPRTRFAEFFVASIYVVGVFTIGFAIAMLLRPVLVRAPATAAEIRRARAIVESWGRTPLAQIALLADKSYFFSAGGSVVAYRLVGDVAVALGDPIGPPQDAAEAVRAFREMCGVNDWQPAFYQTQADYQDLYREAGLRAVKVGHDAIVNVHEFSLSGKRFRQERNLMNRLANEGYVATVRLAPQSPRMLWELRDVSDSWLADMGGSEMGFSLGWFDDDYLRGCDIMIVEGPQGEVEAFANLLREPASNGLTIDLMRYRPSAPEGVMDFAFIRLIEYAADRGFDSFNLGFAALSGVGEQEDPATERVLKLAYEYGNRFYSFKGLYRFKQKFRPCWEPRYLVYPETLALPGVFAAIVRANTGRGDVSQLEGDLAHDSDLTPTPAARAGGDE